MVDLPTLYQEVTAAGCEVDSHESDLYLKAAPIAREIIRRRREAGCLEARNATLFRSGNPADNGAMFFDCPFAFDPYWTKYAARKGAI